MSFNYDLGLQGCYGALKDRTQVKVAGFSENYVIKNSFPLLVADNSYTFVYLVQQADNFLYGMYCPESFLSLADKDVELDTINVGVGFGERAENLDGIYNSFPNGTFVKLKGEDRIYKIDHSFLMLNSATSSIICYKLVGVNNTGCFYCPHSFLVKSFEPDTIVKHVGGDGSGFYG